MSEPLTATIGRLSRAAGIGIDAGAGLRFRLDERWITHRPCDQQFRLRLTGARPPADLETIRVRAQLADDVIDELVEPAPHLSWSHPWDGRRLEGMPATGSAIAPVQIGWVRRRNPVVPRRTEWWNRTAVAGAWDARVLGLGGLVPIGFAHLEPDAAVLWSGNGRRRTGVEVIRGSERSRHGLGWVPARNEDLLVLDGALVHVFLGDGRHLRSFHVNRRLESFRWHFDADERLTGWTIDERHRFRLQADDGSVIVRSPEVPAVRVSVGDDGRARSITDTSGATWTIAFQPSGLLASVTDPVGQWVQIAHQPDGRATSLRWATGARTDTLIEERPGQRHTRVLTGGGRESVEIRRQIDPATTETRVRCCGSSAETVTTRSPGNRVTVKPDGTRISRSEHQERRSGGTIRTRRTTIRTPAGRTTHLIDRRRVEADGTLIEEREQAGAVRTRRHDPNAGVTTEQSPMGRVTRSDLSRDGFRRWSGPGQAIVEDAYEAHRLVRSQRGHSRREFSYDEHDRVVEVREGAGVRRFRYDSTGRLEAEYTGTGWLQYTRDSVGRIIATTTPSGDTTRFELAPDGNVTQRVRPTDAGPITETFTYDADRHLISSQVDGHDPVTATRDAAGQITRLRAGDREIERVWDERTGQLIRSSTEAGDVIEQQYDGHLLVGERVSGVVNGEIHTDHDDAHRPRAVTAAGLTAPIERDGDGRITTYGPVRFDRAEESGLVDMVLAGHLVTRRIHDAFGAVVSETTRFGGRLVFGEQITRDELGRIVQVIEQTPERSTTIDYRYDEAGRLSAVDVDGAPRLALGFDANDNLISADGPERSDALVVGVGDRPTQFRNAPVEVDAAGRVTEFDGRVVDYDGFGRTRAVRTADGRQVEHRRDARGHLIELRVDDVPLWQLLRADGGVVAVLDRAGRGLRTVPCGYQPAPAALFDDQQVFRLITDHRGSVRRVVDATTGDLCQAIEYDALGAITTDTNPGFQPFGYAGSVHDPIAGLVHTGGREMDPVTSRFLQPDPLDLAGGQTNLYVYAGNDPVNRHDPNGLQAGVMRDMPGPGGAMGPVEVCKVTINSSDRSTASSVDHGYLKWGETRRGMGSRRGGMQMEVPVAGWVLPEVEWTAEDQVEKKRENELCREIEDVDVECLDDYTMPGTSLGIYNPDNVCWDAVWDALDHCSDGNWKFGPKRDGDDPSMPAARTWRVIDRAADFVDGFWRNVGQSQQEQWP